MTRGRVPPCSLEAERAVLGACLGDATLMDAVGSMVGAEDWYSEANHTIWEAMLAVAARGEAVDQITLRAELVSLGKLTAVGGDEYLLALTDAVPALAVAESSARIVRDKARVRRMIHACWEAAAEGTADPQDVEAYLDRAEARVFQATAERHAEGGLSPVSEAVIERFQEIQQAAERGEHLQGLPTGLPDLDKKLTGLCGGKLYIVAGRPGMGKSALASRIVEAVSTEGHKTALFSLEMDRSELVDRMICSRGRVDGTAWRRAAISREEWQRASDAAAEVHGWPCEIDDSPALTVLQLRARARRMRARLGLDLVIVDYLQLMRPSIKAQSREQEIADISRQLKALAKELDIPVLAVAQLNRGAEARQDKRPTIGDLRESGQLEQDADAVLLMYRDEVYHPDTTDQGIAEIHVAKQRAGPVGTIRCRYFKESTRFDPLEQHRREDFEDASPWGKEAAAND